MSRIMVHMLDLMTMAKGKNYTLADWTAEEDFRFKTKQP